MFKNRRRVRLLLLTSIIVLASVLELQMLTASQPYARQPRLTFSETGKTIAGKFLAYYQAHGGVAQMGLPISNEFLNKDEQDGKTYRVQYFECVALQLRTQGGSADYVVPLKLRYQDLAVRERWPSYSPDPSWVPQVKSLIEEWKRNGGKYQPQVGNYQAFGEYLDFGESDWGNNARIRLDAEGIPMVKYGVTAQPTE